MFRYYFPLPYAAMAALGGLVGQCGTGTGGYGSYVDDVGTLGNDGAGTTNDGLVRKVTSAIVKRVGSYVQNAHNQRLFAIIYLFSQQHVCLSFQTDAGPSFKGK